MKSKGIFCIILAVLAVASGASAIATSQRADAAGLEKISYDKSALDELSFDRPFIDFSQFEKSAIEFDPEDSSGLEIVLPIRPDFSFSEEDTVPMPSHYCMRDEYVVYAQHQDKQGLCWNFAGTMSASTTLMRHTNEYYDFSELWGTISCLYGASGYNKVGAGGHFTWQTKGMEYGGLMLETDLPYQESYTVSNENAADYYNFFKQYANDDLTDCLEAKSFSRTNVEQIKRHIYNHGSVSAAFTFREGYTPDENGITALPPNQKNTNSAHAVSIIGWDDEYQREFYLDGADTPTLFKGAWIILNSFTETSGTDGLSFVFYEDKNLYDFDGYEYKQDKNKDVYFYDKIEEGYSYPISVKGKYCGDFTAQEGETKQKNIFYDDVKLEYSYTASKNTTIKNISIYLDYVDVTKQFDVKIDNENKRFSIAKEDAAYGNYKVLVSYGNDVKSDVYLNNFYVTYGLMGEKQEFDTETNNLAFNTGRDLEYYSIIRSNKNYAIYTNQLSGNISFLPIGYTSVYSDKNMTIPTLSYEVTDGAGCTVTHTVTSTSGYPLSYNFHVEYYEDTTLQPVTVYYDVGGGVNHPLNYSKELANESTDLVLYAPTREGYVFQGWYLGKDDEAAKASKKGDLYYVNWENIHHMGEEPTLYASSYYKKYYNNSNVLFLYAKWEKAEYYTVTTEAVGGGTIVGENTVTSLDAPTYTFTPNEGYKIKDVKIDGVSVGAVEAYTFEEIAGDHTVSVEFEIIKNKVVLNTEGDGEVSSDKTLEEVEFGESRTLTLTAKKGWKILSVFVNGERVEIADNQLTIEGVKSDVYVTVVLETKGGAVILATVIPLSVVAVSSTAALLYVGIKLRKKRAVLERVEDSAPPNDE